MDITHQAQVFFITLVTGVLLSILFDFYRVLRGIYHLQWAATSVADIVYWLIATSVVFGALLAGNWGELRLYVFIGLALGGVLYYRLFSRHTVHILIRAIRMVNAIIRWFKLFIVYTFLRPLLVCFGVMLYPLIYAKRQAVKLIPKWPTPKPPGGGDPPAP